METCDICLKPIDVPSHYGDYECPHCHQPYGYDEGHQIQLTEAQWALLRNPPRWIPVEERLPEDRQNVIACFPSPLEFMTHAVYEKEPGWFLIPNYGAAQASHWMPLPEPPGMK